MTFWIPKLHLTQNRRF